ncbi:JERKL protein, partial [Polyodon spathula]|nr:JERKL protein [Polyodon spathula]
LSVEHGTGEQTVRHLKKNKEELISCASSSSSSGMSKRKSMKKATWALGMEGDFNASSVWPTWFKNPGHMSSEERLTRMCSANVTGSHKLKFCIIGKVKKTSSFKSLIPQHRVSHSTALTCVETHVDYVEQQDDASLNDKLFLRVLRTNITKKKRKPVDETNQHD